MSFCLQTSHLLSFYVHLLEKVSLVIDLEIVDKMHIDEKAYYPRHLYCRLCNVEEVRNSNEVEIVYLSIWVHLSMPANTHMHVCMHMPEHALGKLIG